MDLDSPACGRCRWQKRARFPAINGEQGGADVGIGVYSGPWEGFHKGDTYYPALGAHYCEHPKQPRGLVLTNYSCPNYERPPEIDNQLQLEG